MNSDVSYQDVVVSCPTSSPPHVLAVLYWYLSTTSLPCSCSIHVHSSATSTVSEDLKRFFDGLPSSNKAKFKLTLIWKSGRHIHKVLGIDVCLYCCLFVVCFEAIIIV